MPVPPESPDPKQLWGLLSSSGQGGVISLGIFPLEPLRALRHWGPRVLPETQSWVASGRWVHPELRAGLPAQDWSLYQSSSLHHLPRWYGQYNTLPW